jgi:hypothetical protein
LGGSPRSAECDVLERATPVISIGEARNGTAVSRIAVGHKGIMRVSVHLIRLLGTSMAALGLVILGISNIMYFRRTKDKHFSRFWLGKNLLFKSEYLLNRIGFSIAVAAIVFMVIMIFALWFRLF